MGLTASVNDALSVSEVLASPSMAVFPFLLRRM